MTSKLSLLVSSSKVSVLKSFDCLANNVKKKPLQGQVTHDKIKILGNF